MAGCRGSAGRCKLEPWRRRIRWCFVRQLVVLWSDGAQIRNFYYGTPGHSFLNSANITLHHFQQNLVYSASSVRVTPIITRPSVWRIRALLSKKCVWDESCLRLRWKSDPHLDVLPEMYEKCHLQAFSRKVEAKSTNGENRPSKNVHLATNGLLSQVQWHFELPEDCGALHWEVSANFLVVLGPTLLLSTLPAILNISNKLEWPIHRCKLYWSIVSRNVSARFNGTIRVDRPNNFCGHVQARVPRLPSAQPQCMGTFLWS